MMTIQENGPIGVAAPVPGLKTLSEQNIPQPRTIGKSFSPARETAIRKRAADVPAKYRPGYLCAAQGKASPRRAIKSFCLECVMWLPEEVTLCTAPACPLFAYRPFQDSPPTHPLGELGGETAPFEPTDDLGHPGNESQPISAQLPGVSP